MTKLRTRLVWLAMRVLSPATLAALRGVLDPLLRRGTLQVLGGLGVGLRLDAAHFPFWGVQSYGFLAGVHEPMVEEALRRALPPGGTFVDVGSHTGIVTLVGARLVGPGGRVVALDAQRECAAATAANVAANGFGWVEVMHAAASDRDGSAAVIVTSESLWTRLADVGEHELEVRRDVVPTVTIDALGLSRLDAVKIDVEGAELAVIAGMASTLRTLRPVVICEMHGKNAEYVALMESFGYRVANLDGPEPVGEAGGNVHTWAEPA